MIRHHRESLCVCVSKSSNKVVNQIRGEKRHSADTVSPQFSFQNRCLSSSLAYAAEVLEDKCDVDSALLGFNCFLWADLLFAFFLSLI